MYLDHKAKEISNVTKTKIDLVASEFSSSNRTVSNIHNSEISWINANESNVGYPIYTAQISYGIYTMSSLQTEIVQKTSTIPRDLPIAEESSLNHRLNISALETQRESDDSKNHKSY